ncbi:MAG: hypothetical protein E7463_01010 [Ruminococcaceae bacterium]|nr:hypothetical protein [Oscillospiraceae bacterium]
MSDYKSALPPVDTSLKLSLPHFPTRMQALIFRMWEMVPAAKLAEVLGTTEEIVRALAADMALPPQKDTDVWQSSGYITIIRAAWHLLPYEQLLTLLGWDAEKLSYILKEDDFLSHKLGNKFPCEPILYAPLTAEEQAETALLRETILRHVRTHDAEDTVDPFNFFPTAPKKRIPGICPADACANLLEGWELIDETDDARAADFIADFREDMALWGVGFVPSEKKLVVSIDPALAGSGDETHEVNITFEEIRVTGASAVGVLRGLSHLRTLADAASGPYYKPLCARRTPAFDARFIYSYCGLYGSALDVDTAISYPDELLRAYSRNGVNGVWLQAVLYKLVEFPFDPSLSEGWQERQARLRDLVARAARYGLKVWLYINEPRAMPHSFFDTRPELRGHQRGELSSMCTSVPAVQEYLKSGITSLCTQVPGLGGFFTISVSENQTNCYSHGVEADGENRINCPRCAERRPWEVIAEVNSLIADAAHAVDPSIKTIVWTWGWGRMGREGMHKAIELLSPNCILQNTSEEKMDISIAGIDSQVVDYTLSQIPPSKQSRDAWEQALATGHKTSAKVQFNCTWEGSTAPYIPVYENVIEYIRRLRAIGVENLQLSWTLGGWPSENLRIASSYFFEDAQDSFSYEDALRASYGADAGIVKEAVNRFCRAFAEFPFHVGTLYRGPQNAGPANLLFASPTGHTATMTCYTYDDLESWRSIYPVDVFTGQLKKLAAGWQEGLDVLAGMPDCDFKDTARICGALFSASYNQTLFVQARDAFLASPTAENRAALISVIADEKKLAEETLQIMYRDARVGYEAANHYYFSRTSLMEKILNCAWLEQHFG